MNNKWTPRQRGMSRLVLLSTILIAAGHAHAATVPVTGYIVVNPIDVCSSSGAGCAPFNTQSSSPNPAQATTTTPIGFVDPPTNVNVTRAIWLQTGIDITFLPIQQYNNTTYQNIDDVSCTESTCTGPLTSTKFKAITTIGAKVSNTGCKSNCTVPLASSKANAINMFFVNTINGTFGTGGVGALAGFAWLNGNGVAVASNVFFPGIGQSPRFDTLAHELGHNLNLDHTTFGAGGVCSGVPSPAACNVMDAGSINGANFRNIPTSSGCSTTGALFDLDTGLCATGPTAPQADQLILGNSPSTQQSETLLTGFLNPIPNVNATAGGGDVSFTVDFPKLKTAGGRSGEYIFALVIALPQGFAFGPNTFVETGGTAQVFGFEQLNGNNGQGNTNCLKPITGAPSIQCGEIDFVPGTFTANTSTSFTLNIINKSTGAEATLGELAGTGLTYVFSDLLATTSALAFRDNSGDLTANSQLPDAGVTSTIVDPTNFPSVANLNPPLTLQSLNQVGCTPFTATMCQQQAGSWKNTGE